MACLAIARVLFDRPNERRFLQLARQRLGHRVHVRPVGLAKRLRQPASHLLQAMTLLAGCFRSGTVPSRPLLNSTHVEVPPPTALERTSNPRAGEALASWIQSGVQVPDLSRDLTKLAKEAFCIGT